MSTVDAVIAANRFGLGARPGELATIAADPRGWLHDQLAGAVPRPAALASRPAASDRARDFMEARESGPEAVARLLRGRMQDAYKADAGARTRAAIDSDRPFVERLVHFWSNHFTVSTVKPVLAGLAGPYEAEAIRPHVMGNFAEMLQAVVRHPAMLLYLDNAQSIGPNSPAGRRRGRGLNENLARELLELHTLGVDGGYAQDDVRALAEILTGWMIDRDRRPGAFRFMRPAHEPGDKVLLGARYREAGQAEGDAALDALARHPSTARHVATKLVRHFVADDPPRAAVDHIANVFLSSGGDLRLVAGAMVDLPDAWTTPLPKVRSPNDMVIAALRALQVPVEDDKLVGSLHLLGQAPFRAGSPAGWPDTAAEWLGPEALMRRTDWAVAVGGRVGRRTDPRLLAEQSIGPVASEETKFLIEGAPSAGEGVAMALLSPEFQRR
jgi:uncharacterized protein (DUF1800 family)